MVWCGDDGFYADAQGQYTWFDSDLRSDTLGALVEGLDGDDYALSLERGLFGMGDDLTY